MATIQCKAAVAWEPNKPISIETIEVAPPQKGEVRIKIMTTSVCHTDLISLSGVVDTWCAGNFPMILGHEGAGVVESIGEGVTSVAPGDVVVPCCLSQCRSCKQCQHSEANYCEAVAETRCNGTMMDGTTRFKCNGKTVYHYFGCSTFSEYTVVNEIQVCKVDQKAPFEIAGLLACGFTTGYGAANYAAKVKEGSSCAIWGLGCIGLSTLIGCKRAGASRIIVIDPKVPKFEIAKKLGATDFINPLETDVLEQIGKLTQGEGCDYTFECVGKPQTVLQAVDASNVGYGYITLIGVLPGTGEMNFPMSNLLCGRTMRGIVIGQCKVRDHIPQIMEEYLAGRLTGIENLITHRLNLEDINEAIRLTHHGECVRAVMTLNK